MKAAQSNQSQPTGPQAPISMLMTRAVARISPDARLDELSRKLAAVEVGALAVGTETTLTGIVSERDVVRAYGRAEHPETMQVRDIASTDLIWSTPDTTAAEAARLMCAHGVRHLLVGVKAGPELQGIVSARALLEAVVDQK